MSYPLCHSLLRMKHSDHQTLDLVGQPNDTLGTPLINTHLSRRAAAAPSEIRRTVSTIHAPLPHGQSAGSFPKNTAKTQPKHSENTAQTQPKTHSRHTNSPGKHTETHKTHSFFS